MQFASSPTSSILCILSVIFLVGLDVELAQSQFISHFNSKGLRGNITFDTRQEAASELSLVIEAIVESHELSDHGDEGLFNKSVPILFDWSFHTNTLTPHMLKSCSDDELGQTISEVDLNRFTSEHPIILNQRNRWTVPFQSLFVNSTVTKTVSSLIWGRSIRLRLSKSHSTRLDSDDHLSGPSKATSGVVKPMLKPFNNKTQSNPALSPRPKPTLNKPKIASLPKPEALEMTTAEPPRLNLSQLESPAQLPVPDEQSLIATNSRISKMFDKVKVCGNVVDKRLVKSAEAVFESEIAGRATIRGNQDGTTLILLNFYHVKSKVTTRHDWKIMASDILDNRKPEERCKYLQAVFNPDYVDGKECNMQEMAKCRLGDLTKKHGQLQVAGSGKTTRVTLLDTNLPISSLEGSRSLFLVIFDSNSKGNILNCAQIRSSSRRRVQARFNMDGVRGTVEISQDHFSEPALVAYDLTGLEGNVRHQSIRELPLAARSSADNSKLCNALGRVYDPNHIRVNQPSKHSTFDTFPVGNLSGKHGNLLSIESEESDYEDHYRGEFYDTTVQLHGPTSVAGRSIVIHKNNGEPWVCATLEYIDESVLLAVATFHYPVVGKISFRQMANDPHSETGVLVELYNPNADKDSDGHNWMIHVNPTYSDFYNWSQRCASAGEPYDPIQSATGLSNDAYSRTCRSSLVNEPLRCIVGDLGLKSGFQLPLSMSHSNKTRYFYTDLYLPLSKSGSIIGRSVVLYDDHAPTQRGNRLACSSIRLVHVLKATIKTWTSGPSIPSTIHGSVSFEQNSALQSTNVRFDLSGFNGNVENYAIHDAWTMEDREFPCSNDSLYDIYDPYGREHSFNLPASAHYGVQATVDRVKVGDMSRKHGTFEGLQSIQKTVIDANAPLFAPHSIVGRSLVLRAAVNDFRWVCGNVELAYDKGESREIIGIASFDDPRSKIAGYVRFFQLEHSDGSTSDTYVQIDMKMQSDYIHELQTSENHNWAVFVNQVGEDAFISADDVRCIAAGFKWNPYLAQDTLDTYPNICNRQEHQGCAMGDLGSRHGSLTLGPNHRRTISDCNLPLTGNYSVMGRSLVIFDNKRPSVKLGCANILPDIHLKSNVVIKRTPSFTVARFIDEMRSLLGAAEWLVVPDLKATKPVANGECIQMTIHFYGQKAHQLQVELNNLVTLGTVRKSTRIGVEKISTHYKLCRVGEMQLTSSGNRMMTAHWCILVIVFLNLLTNSLIRSKRATFQ